MARDRSVRWGQVNADDGRPGAMRRTGDAIRIPGEYQHRARTAGPVVQRFWHAEKERIIRKFFPPRPGDVVIDVGCGSGVQSALLASLGARTTGVDGSQEAIAYARSAFSHENLEFKAALVEDLLFPAGSVDRIYCFELIEHIYEPQALALLRTFHRLAKDTAILLITTPNYAGTWPLIEFVMDRLRLAPQLDEAQHVTHYTHRRLRRVLEQAGWRVDRIGTFSTFSPFLSPISWQLATRVAELEDRLALPFGNILLAIGRKA